jgi:ribonuclease VapC
VKSASVDFYVLDSFAILAFLQDESGAEHLQQVFKRIQLGKAKAFLSMINLGEVIYLVERQRGLLAAQNTLATIEALPLEFLPATRERVLAAAHIKAHFPMSYADTFAIAAAQECGATVLTGDPEYQAVEKNVPIEWLDR